MKHDIDIFRHPTLSSDHRWDRDQNAKLLNIVFQGGTFGNFLKFFLDKFSKLSPDLDGDPFNKNGTSHKMDENEYSGLVQKYHFSFINDNEGKTDLPICTILPTKKKHYLYLKKAQLYRAGDRKVAPDDLWQKPLGEMKEKLPDYVLAIKKLYGLSEDKYYSWFPKFIVRDWYKLEFLMDLEDTYNYQVFEIIKEHKFFGRQNMFYLDMETFFNWDTFLENIKKINNKFGLDLDFDRHAEMKILFDEGIRLDSIRQESNIAEQVLEHQAHHDFKDLDVTTEAFIYAEVEKKYSDIQMPLTNRFFRDTEEIHQFIDHFPNWYRRPNPNLG